MNQELELKNVVRNLRKDLQALDEEGQGKDLKFKVEAIDLELKVAAKQTDGVDGGIKFYVFNLGASDKAESEQALTIKLKLVPETAVGGTLKVSRATTERPVVPGDGE